MLLKYLYARDLSFATSLTINTSYPKFEKIANMAVNAMAKEYFPKITSPKVLAIKINKTRDNIEFIS